MKEHAYINNGKYKIYHTGDEFEIYDVYSQLVAKSKNEKKIKEILRDIDTYIAIKNEEKRLNNIIELIRTRSK